MEHLPIFLTTEGHKTLVVGGGEIAARKIRLILKTTSDICVIAPSICPELSSMVRDNRIQHIGQKFDPALLEGADLVFAATDIEDVDATVASAARAKGILVNAADKPHLSDFIMPSIVDRSPIVVAISSSGTAPVLARHIRAKIEALLPKNLGTLASFANRYRGAVKAVVSGFDNRRRFWENFFEGPIAKDVLAGNENVAQDAMLAIVNSNQNALVTAGIVHYLDAPVNQPDLLTFKAMNALQSADLVVFDERTPASFLEYVRRDAEQLFVGIKDGKQVAHPSIVKRLLADAARRGRKVIRLTVNSNVADFDEQQYLASREVSFDQLPTATVAPQQTIYSADNVQRFAQA